MTLVLLHGFTGAPGSFDDLRERLARPDVLAPPLLGHAGAPSSARTWDHEIDRVAALLPDPAHVVGYSMGGRVALALALRHPARIAGLTLIGASPGIEDPAERDARRRADEARARVLETEGVEAFVRGWENEPIFETQRRIPEPVQARHRAIRRSHSASGLAACLRVLGQGAMPSLWAALGALSIPVRLVVGGEDPKLRGIAERMLERLPHGTLHVATGAGHDVVLERPDTLTALLLQDLERPA